MASQPKYAQTSGSAKDPPDLTHPKVRKLFGENVAGVLKGGDLLTPMDRGLLQRLACELGETDRLFIFKICMATAALSPTVVAAVARVLKLEPSWFFLRHTSPEFARIAAKLRPMDTPHAARAAREREDSVAAARVNTVVALITRQIENQRKRASEQDRARAQEALKRRGELIAAREQIMHEQRELEAKNQRLARELAAIDVYFSVLGSPAPKRRRK